MALESFYGGKPGISPVIKERFKYINTEDPAYIQKLNKETTLTADEKQRLIDARLITDTTTEITWNETNLAPFTMDECFKRTDYTDVWYSEFCIIDTDNKDNPNNGKLYRRTLKRNTSSKTNDSLYAEYMGQIVGPQGSTPRFYIGTSLDDTRQKAVNWDDKEGTTDKSLDYTYLTYDNNNNKIITYTDPESYTDIGIIEDTDGVVLVPGKDENENYHDKIRYTWCNVRKDGEDGNFTETWVYLGFEIPYTVFDINFTKAEYYKDLSFTDNSDPNHPFYRQWNLTIPRGGRGVSIEKIFIVGKDNVEKPTDGDIYDIDGFNISYSETTDNYSIRGTKLSSNFPMLYWLAKIVLYNRKEKNNNTWESDIKYYYLYLGSYREVENIIRNNQNSTDLTIEYSDNSTKSLENILPKEVTSLSLDSNDKLNINYNTNESSSTDIVIPTSYIKSISGELQSEENQYKLTVEKEGSLSPDIFKIPLDSSGINANQVIKKIDYYPGDNTLKYLYFNENDNPPNHSINLPNITDIEIFESTDLLNGDSFEDIEYLRIYPSSLTPGPARNPWDETNSPWMWIDSSNNEGGN